LIDDGPSLIDLAARIVPRNPLIRFKPVTVADEPFLRYLFNTVRAADFAGAGLPQAMLDVILDQQFRAQSKGYATQFPGATSLVVVKGSERVGRLLLAEEERRWHIVDIALLPSVRGQGIGSDIISAAARAAEEQGAEQLTLSVLAGNLAAQRLYLRLGFAAVDGDGVRVTMTKRLAV
jgi:ribosomal protein S18 acetylase RimI-like enzyme